MVTAAVFDIDGTMLKPSSGLLYVIHLRRKKEINVIQILRITLWQLLHTFGLINIEKVAQVAAYPYKDTKEKEMIEATREWFRKDVIKHIRPKAVKRFKKHRKSGHALFIVTGASPYLAQPFAEYFGIKKRFISTKLEVIDGLFSGKMTRIVYGKEKGKALDELTKKYGLDLENTYAYADSISDKPLLDKVGKPVAVNPDPLLLLTALFKGWRIEWW